MARIPIKTRDATEELIGNLRRINLDPVAVLSRAITLAETDSDYKVMVDASLGMMPYLYPKLKESVVKADIDQTISGGGVNLNITVGGKRIVGDPDDEEELPDELTPEQQQLELNLDEQENNES